MSPKLLFLIGICLITTYLVASAQDAITPQADITLSSRLADESASALAADVVKHGDPRRGAIAFGLPAMNCARCHDSADRKLGPNLAKRRAVTTEHLIESVLNPSATIHGGFESVRVLIEDGRMITGVLVSENKDSITIDSIESQSPRTIRKDQIEDRATSKVSSMPTDLVNQLSSRQQFLDLISYLAAIAEDPTLQSELRPLTTVSSPLPEYETRVDHAGLIQGMDDDAFKRGEEVYRLRCATCHGTVEAEGSMPTSLRFASGKFKSGTDPLTMYHTMTHGYGMMNPQRWMVPQQKYDVIHYIREHFLKQHNRSQRFEITEDYLASLPKGDTRGPDPVMLRPWTIMNYGHSMINTIEVSDDGSNIAQKGIVVRLDDGPGGVESGSHWIMYEHDTLRVAAAWSGQFIDWQGIHFNGSHATHPRVAGQVEFENPTGPGFGRPDSDSMARFDDDRVVGRDGKHYGPLPRDWARHLGMYRFGKATILKYRVGEAEILESPSLSFIDSRAVYTRTLNVGKRSHDIVIQVANLPGESELLQRSFAVVAATDSSSQSAAASLDSLDFDGGTFAQIENGAAFDMSKSDYSITARIKTRSDGTIFSKTRDQADWLPQGKTFFVRDGRLTFDVGWVGDVQADLQVDDDHWHDVTMTFSAKRQRVRLFVDGKACGTGRLRRIGQLTDSVIRIGFTNQDFPNDSAFRGQLKDVRFFQRELEPRELLDFTSIDSKDLVGTWSSTVGDTVPEGGGDRGLNAILSGSPSKDRSRGLAAITSLDSATWSRDDSGNLRLTIPAGDSVNLTISHTAVDTIEAALDLKADLKSTTDVRDLSAFITGGPANYPESQTTEIIRGADDGPFAVDVFKRPTDNPWNCRLRLTGIDFLSDSRTAIVSSWDGSVWRVTGMVDSDNKAAKWQRIAAGLFQPLGVKCIDDDIYVTCRDQIVRLHDLNGDHEIDWYENFNSDHQVTEHFHEFAMGLQTDSEGNFYYAKSARHAKEAVVPHHGTLLKVSADGSRTEIVANGFRAANGVCVNDDGSFVVTDQEGHWNPKNRINWVQPGEFYGNMFGYHDVSDKSDSAMQDPLCWITNSFDRSPGELLWVKSKQWGPLEGSLLNLSYGHGKAYIVPHESVGGKVQGGMCELPLGPFPTGVMRGRFNPIDGQLYCCGMFAWAGNQQAPGGLYRIRYTDKPVHVPTKLQARTDELVVEFSGLVDRKSATKAGNYKVKAWDLKRTRNYGSEHYNERTLDVAAVRCLDDGRTVVLSIPELETTWSMEISFDIRTSQGKKLSGRIHNSIFRLGQDSKHSVSNARE